MSPEFIHETKPEILTNETVSVDKARFADRLEPEHEEAWNTLVTLGKDTDMTIEGLMTPVWLADSLPQVFRDRAMLLVVGTGDARKALGQETYRTNGSFAFGKLTVGTYEKVVSGFNPDLFCNWTQEAWKYQQETGKPIISDQRYLHWNYEFFERGLIGEAELDDFLDKIDIVASSPTWEGTGWDGDVYQLDGHRFPLLSDIFNARTVGRDSERTRTWALHQLESWLRYQKDKNADTPDWLRAVPEATGKALFRELINSGDKPDWFSWDLVRAATNQFGLEIFNRHPSDFNLMTVHTVDDPQFKEELLKIILRAQNTKASTGKRYYPLTGTSYSGGSRAENVRSIDIINSVIRNTNDEELKELFELELRHAKEYEERFRQESEARMRAYKAKQEVSPKYQEQQRARAAFLSQVAGLSELTD